MAAERAERLPELLDRALAALAACAFAPVTMNMRTTVYEDNFIDIEWRLMAWLKPAAAEKALETLRQAADALRKAGIHAHVSTARFDAELELKVTLPPRPAPAVLAVYNALASAPLRLAAHALELQRGKGSQQGVEGEQRRPGPP